MNITHLVSNKVWGGGEQYVYDLCSNLSAQGHTVTVVHKPLTALRSKLGMLNVPLHEMPLKGLADLRSAHKLSKLVGDGRQVLHVHNFKDAFTAAIARKLSGNKDVRIVLTRHLVRPGKDSFLYRWLYNQLDCMIFVSELAQNKFLSTVRSQAVPLSKVIHNSITITDNQQETDLKKELGIATDSTILMFHGRIEQEKGLLTLIDAFSSIDNSNLHLVLFGTGSESFRLQLEEKINQAGISPRVHFAGFRSNVSDYIRHADMGVIPSIVAEACPLSCMEYMSQGKCIITTDNGGQAEYIESGKTGILVSPGNHQDLAQAIILASDKQTACEIGAQASDWFKNHLSYSVFYRKITDCYNSLFQPE